MIDELAQVAPEEKEAMLTAGQQLEQRGMQAGMQQGMQQSVQQEKHEIARRMLSDGIDLKVIKKYTGLAEKELKLLH